VDVLFEAVDPTDEAADDDDEPTTAAFAGICFFLTGNQAVAEIALEEVALAKFGYIGRGNSPLATLDVREGSSAAEFLVDLSGNSGKLIIKGSGTYECPGGKLKGNQSSIECGN